MTSRRGFVLGLGGAVLPAMTAHALTRILRGRSQEIRLPGADVDTTNLFLMNQAAALPVRLPPKPGARASMTVAERDDLERRLRCPCGCTHDLFVCRTTDLDCAVAPRMHDDIVSLVAGGYDAAEIEAEFVSVFGDGIRVVPRAEGFNLLGWMVPYAVYAAALALAARALWRMRHTNASVGEAP